MDERSIKGLHPSNLMCCGLMDGRVLFLHAVSAEPLLMQLSSGRTVSGLWRGR